jgi:CO/xanthine dehydrogenase Mo-binding subunit
LPTRDRIITSRNSAVLAKEKVLFGGQPVAVVVAESEAQADDARDQVMIEYEPLPGVVDMLEAMAPDAPVIWPQGLPQAESELTAVHAAVDKETTTHAGAPTNVVAENHYQRGNVEQGFQEADVVIERTYRTSIVHQSYMEPHAVVADPDPFQNSLTLYTSTQAQFLVRDEVAELLSLPISKVRVVPLTFGGGFGAKYGILEPLVSAVAVALKRPVRMVLTRSEDFLTTTPAASTMIELKTGARRDGTVTALKARAVVDNGIFPFPLVGAMIGILVGSYYKFPHLQIDCYEVITNKPQTGAYRAPGAPQATFAVESSMDDMARELGLDPLEFRLKNAAEPGDLMSNGEPWPHHGLKQCLERMREHPAWQSRARRPNEGTGLAVGGWPTGFGPAAAVCRVDHNGTVWVHVGSVDISGINSSFVLIAAEVLGVSPDQVEIIQGDTRSGPYAGASGGSQTTYSVSNAIHQAAQSARQQLLELAADELEARLDDLELKEGHVSVRGVPDRGISIAKLADIAESRAGGPGPIIGQGHTAPAKNSPGFVVHLTRVRVDPETGHVEPKQYVAIQDVGFALNPLLVEGQVHGGTVQGIGMGLHEAMVYDKEGQLLTGSFMDYSVPMADSVPSIETILIQNASPYNVLGARGIGEPPIVAGAAALGNAIKDATGVRLTQLPMRAETLWRALQDQR